MLICLQGDFHARKKQIDIKSKENLILTTIKQIEKAFGKGAIMLLSDDSISDIEVIGCHLPLALPLSPFH